MQANISFFESLTNTPNNQAVWNGRDDNKFFILDFYRNHPELELTPNLESLYYINKELDRSFKSNQWGDNAEDRRIAALNGSAFLADYFNNFGIDCTETYKDIRFSPMSEKATKERPNTHGCYSLLAIKPTVFLKTNGEHLVHTIVTTMHELTHAVSHLSTYDYMIPHRSHIPEEEQNRINSLGIGEKHIFDTPDSREDPRLPEYSTVGISTLDKKIHSDVVKLWRDYAQLTKDEVTNRPYSTIRSYLDTEKNGRTSGAQYVLMRLDSCCSRARTLNKKAADLFNAFFDFTIPYKATEKGRENLMPVPLVDDSSTKLYGDLSRARFGNSKKSRNMNGLLTAPIDVGPLSILRKPK